jgi:nicotinate-nucleotide--dimethylbenzimidazole phosphoribosyltransferase
MTVRDPSPWLADLPAPSDAFRAAARARQRQLTKPTGSLGRLEDVAVFMAGWSRDGTPRAERVAIHVFAGNHGVVAQGVSPYPAAVTAQMVKNFQAGGAAINALARTAGTRLGVHALDPDRPTGDIAVEAAMSLAETEAAIAAGAAAVTGDLDLLVLGEMGIGNTTIAAALAAQVCGGGGSDWAGAGTGLDAAGVARKAAVVDRALARCRDVPRSAIATLAALGGREIAALAGAIVAARRARVPVLIDGFVVTAALAVLAMENPAVTAHALAGHVSAERAHRRLLAHLDLPPLLDLGLRLGEASGAAVALPIVRAAVAAHVEMATFGEAGVSGAGP